MTSRTRVPRWAPPLADAVRLAWRPALAYLLFAGLGSLVLMFTIALESSSGGKDVVLFAISLVVAMIGIVLGQLVAMLRLRALPVFVVTGVCVTVVVVILSIGSLANEFVFVPLLFFCLAFPCGLLSLMHRWELFASFWPAVGWIGSAISILNREGRVGVWEQNKVMAWLPVPLLMLGGFLVFWLFYLAAKQSSRVEMWQALSGAAARRIVKAAPKRFAAVPRKNVLPLLVLSLVLFVIVAILAPFLWRTGKGERHGEHETPTEPKDPPRQGPEIDGEGLVKQLQKMAQAAKETLPKLWPLLLLLLLYRPAKRALLVAHLKAPIVPTPPSERIDNLWEYIRVAAEDIGIVPTSADSVEQLLSRIEREGRSSPALGRAADIYVRTRYGFVVQRGDAVAMRLHATEAANTIRADLRPWAKLRCWWRPLS